MIKLFPDVLQNVPWQPIWLYIILKQDQLCLFVSHLIGYLIPTEMVILSNPHQVSRHPQLILWTNRMAHYNSVWTTKNWMPCHSQMRIQCWGSMSWLISLVRPNIWVYLTWIVDTGRFQFLKTTNLKLFQCSIWTISVQCNVIWVTRCPSNTSTNDGLPSWWLWYFCSNLRGQLRVCVDKLCDKYVFQVSYISVWVESTSPVVQC